MARLLRRLAPLTLSALAAAATPAAAAPERSAALGLATPSFSWTGKDAPGANTSYFLDGTATTGSCAKTDATTQCDETLVTLTDDYVTRANSALRFEIGSYSMPASDFDIRVYEVKPTGSLTKVGDPVSETYGPMGLGPLATFAGDAESTTVTGATALKPGKRYLVQVVYFTTVGTYGGKATLSNVDPKPAPPAGG